MQCELMLTSSKIREISSQLRYTCEKFCDELDDCKPSMDLWRYAHVQVRSRVVNTAHPMWWAIWDEAAEQVHG